ncbi:ergothioneine biosynthesis protein EgtC [Streptomyces sp. NPDC057702]|uniref:ergothioneine biosynthesis protein EgtC n=1 Tax=unclassified Streptomyces TaxID=2593676 RepID=UPI003682357C
MCRHLAYLGDEVSIATLLTRPAHGLLRQSWQPRRQRHGTVNADGFGVGWYAAGDPVPARYRRSGPIWADLPFADLARVVRSTALLGAVRDATEPGADGEAAAAPFGGGPWLFSHNGSVRGWPGTAASLVATLPPEAVLGLEARNDAAFVWALALHRLRAGAPPGRALAETVVAVDEAAPGSRLNLLLTDGVTIAATTWGDSLWYRTEPGPEARGGPGLAAEAGSPTGAGSDAGASEPGPSVPPGGIVVASEPYDDDPHWIEVPDRTLVTATRSGVRLSAITRGGADRPPPGGGADTAAPGTVSRADPGAAHPSPTAPPPSGRAPGPGVDRPHPLTPAPMSGLGSAVAHAARPSHTFPHKESSP